MPGLLKYLDITRTHFVRSIELINPAYTIPTHSSSSTNLAMLNASGRLAIAELIIYIIIFPIAVYILVRHGKPGYIGWGFFLVFCTLRIVSSGLGVNDTSTIGGIINSVGISALLLAISGVIHEA
jgi:prolipoprotein diacylglyceryltransferase